MFEKPNRNGRYFGLFMIALLTILWFVGGVLWLQGALSGESFYTRLAALLPNILPALGWTLTFTLIILWGGLIWSRYYQSRVPIKPLSPDEMIELDPGEFEKYVASFFHHKGFRVRHRGKSGDHGVDLEVKTPGDQLGIVQCKRYRHTVGEQIVRDLYGTMLHEGAVHAYLVTANEISKSARRWAVDKPITLVDGTTLHDLIKAVKRI